MYYLRKLSAFNSKSHLLASFAIVGGTHVWHKRKSHLQKLWSIPQMNWRLSSVIVMRMARMDDNQPKVKHISQTSDKRYLRIQSHQSLIPDNVMGDFTGIALGSHHLITVLDKLGGCRSVTHSHTKTAHVIQVDPKRNIALLYTSADLTTAEMTTEEPKVGESIAIVGNVTFFNVIDGIISCPERVVNDYSNNIFYYEPMWHKNLKLIQYGASTERLNSGGPLVKLDNGKVYGIVMKGPTSDINFALHTSQFKDYIEGNAMVEQRKYEVNNKYKDLNKSKFGFMVYNIDQQFKQMLTAIAIGGNRQLSSEKGLYVWAITAKGNHPLKEGDVITKIGGTEATMDVLRTECQKKKSINLIVNQVGGGVGVEVKIDPQDHDYTDF
ncbi:uncharacterized protein LOC128961212 [Oppia nitens]|uniref:uncharacterized protein LOC128961212 n=1 Tax=Oppia nitens TaxID=1686743 RepID=UPI0023DAEB5F|nr:uncharacterized protein LOC128961212 [Oppia nitens]